MQDLFYYILMVKCGLEFKVVERLEEEGFRVACPSYELQKKIRHKKADVLVDVKKPVLDGYVFVDAFGVATVQQLQITSDILKAVSFAGLPALVSKSELGSVAETAKRLESVFEKKTMNKGQLRPAGLAPGEKIKISRGDLEVVGKYVSHNVMETELQNIVVKVSLKGADKIERIKAIYI